MKGSNKKWILLVTVILLVGGGFYYVKKNQAPDKSYREILIKKDDLVLRVDASGTVSPQNRLEIKPPIAGRIEEVLVREGEVVKKGRILAWISSSERAALLDSVRAQGSQELKKWEELYKPTPVMAPISGTIILRNVESGQSFTNVDSIFTMADRLTVKAQVDETDISQIKVNQPAVITLDAYPKDPVIGKVVHMAYDATVANNVTTYIVDVLPHVVPEFMRSGMTSNVSIEVTREVGVLLLPLSAVMTDDEGSRVRIKNGKKNSLIPVELGSDDGKFVSITSGLTEGDVVLVEEEVKNFNGKKKPTNPLMPGGGPRRGGGRR